MSYVEIALIPARGGSVGIPRKNLQEISGKTLVQIAVECAKKAKIFKSIVVSTDDSEIARIAEDSGAEVHWRSSKSSDNSATAFDVVNYFINSTSIDKNLRICYLQPTSPFRTSENIIEAFMSAELHDSKSCVSVKKVSDHPEKMVKINNGVISRSVIKQNNQTANRQNLEEFFIPNGAIYIFPVERFIREKMFPIFNSAAYIMSESSSIDIDSETDLIVARMLWSEMYGINNNS